MMTWLFYSFGTFISGTLYSVIHKIKFLFVVILSYVGLCKDMYRGKIIIIYVFYMPVTDFNGKFIWSHNFR